MTGSISATVLTPFVFSTKAAAAAAAPAAAVPGQLADVARRWLWLWWTVSWRLPGPWTVQPARRRPRPRRLPRPRRPQQLRKPRCPRPRRTSPAGLAAQTPPNNLDCGRTVGCEMMNEENDLCLYASCWMYI